MIKSILLIIPSITCAYFYFRLVIGTGLHCYHSKTASRKEKVVWLVMMGITMPLASLAYALMEEDFQQKRLLKTSLIGLSVSALILIVVMISTSTDF